MIEDKGIEEYIESQRIKKTNHFKTKKAAILNSIRFTVGIHEWHVYINGILKIKPTNGSSE